MNHIGNFGNSPADENFRRHIEARREKNQPAEGEVQPAAPQPASAPNPLSHPDFPPNATAAECAKIARAKIAEMAKSTAREKQQPPPLPPSAHPLPYIPPPKSNPRAQSVSPLPPTSPRYFEDLTPRTPAQKFNNTPPPPKEKTPEIPPISKSPTPPPTADAEPKAVIPASPNQAPAPATPSRMQLTGNKAWLAIQHRARQAEQNITRKKELRDEIHLCEQADKIALEFPHASPSIKKAAPQYAGDLKAIASLAHQSYHPRHAEKLGGSEMLLRRAFEKHRLGKFNDKFFHCPQCDPKAQSVPNATIGRTKQKFYSNGTIKRQPAAAWFCKICKAHPNKSSGGRIFDFIKLMHPDIITAGLRDKAENGMAKAVAIAQHWNNEFNRKYQPEYQFADRRQWLIAIAQTPGINLIQTRTIAFLVANAYTPQIRQHQTQAEIINWIFSKTGISRKHLSAVRLTVRQWKYNGFHQQAAKPYILGNEDKMRAYLAQSFIRHYRADHSKTAARTRTILAFFFLGFRSASFHADQTIAQCAGTSTTLVAQIRQWHQKLRFHLSQKIKKSTQWRFIVPTNFNKIITKLALQFHQKIPRYARRFAFIRGSPSPQAP